MPTPDVVDARPPPPPDSTPLPDAAPREAQWLRGSTHVHALPSGDSKTPIPEVVAWYEAHGYDFIFLTDHNRVSEVAPDSATAGQPWVRWPGQHDRARDRELIVLAGSELTFNPDVCDPPAPERDGKCRIHLNALGPTARPADRIEWPQRDSPVRLVQIERAVAKARELGAPLVQLNHPQWHWGTTPALLVDAIARGVTHMEIANKQFAAWNAGTAVYPSTEQLWDAALATGATVWGVASDDAHHYTDDPAAQYPAGGAYVVVRATREPAAILAALAEGRFYASTGVELARAETAGPALVVEVADGSPGAHTIRFIVNGKPAATLVGRAAAHPIPAAGTVRAVVERADGAKAWVQPVRAHAAR